MARIPTDELERLKREVPVQRLAEARGVKLTPHGDNLVGLCPFHDDREPSLVISPKKNLWNCLGACGRGGSVVDWVMTADGVGFREAVVALMREAGPGSTGSAVPAITASDDAELLGQVADYYHDALKGSPVAQRYLESRGLADPEMVERFRLGFANRTLGPQLPPKQRASGARIRRRLQGLGVIRASGHEHLAGSVVIPVHDAEGRVVQLYGRKVRSDLRVGTALHLYLPGPHRGVFNLDALRVNKEVILCEALIDALTFWSAGFRNVTSAYGTNGFTTEMLEAFKAYGVERVLIAFDRDDAGDRAAAKLADRLGAEGIGCFRVGFPRGMDANSYALKVSPAARSLELLIRKAAWMGRGEAPAVILGARPVADCPAERPAISSVITDPTPDLPLAAKEESSLPVKTQAAPASTSTSSAEESRRDEVFLRFGDRSYRVRGLAKNTAYDVMKVSVLVSSGELLHVDTLNLYSARQRSAFVGQAAVELGVKEDVVKKDLGRLLLELEQLQDVQIRQAMTPEETIVTISDSEREEALELLSDPQLLERIVDDLEACGLVGEDTNKLTAYLAAVSRKMDRPLAVLVQSSSAAGKSTLLDAVLALVPEEERVSYSAMTGQSLFYMGEADLKHKALAIAEEEGAERASYALKLLQSEGALAIASTGKDPSTGRLVTHSYRVEGPVAIMLTTTAADIDEELLNRCLLLSVDGPPPVLWTES